MKALQIVAAALGKSLGGIQVEVDPNASTAYTNGRKVVLPVLPVLVDEERADVTLGLVCHESFHIRDTYLGGRLKGLPPEGITYTPLKKRLQNALEDARIEHRGFKRYPGSRKFLDALVTFAIREGWFRNPSRKTKPGNLVLFGLLFHYRAHFLGQHALDAIADAWEKKAIKTFGPDLWDRMVAIADKAVVANNPEAPWYAADEICRLLAGKDANAAKQAAESEDNDLDQTDLAEMLPSDSTAAKNGTDVPIEKHLVQPVKESPIASYLDLSKGESKRVYRKVAGPLEAKLWAKAQEDEWVSRTGTAGVVSNSLYNVQTTGRVFRNRVDGDSRSMTVHLLLDSSGSMGAVNVKEKSNYWANAGAFALVQLFSALGIEWSVSWFDDEYYPGRTYSSAPLSPKDPWLVVAGGYTELPKAMSEAGKQLVCEAETDRKLLLVLTDGRANEAKTKPIDDALMDQGIEVRYVLIGALQGFGFAKDRVSHGEMQNTATAMIGAFRTFA
ncbi:hypothetical protein H7F10_06880 [Acidithiobacillus sp. HP-6]|uniref:hypothetical protein n=1 Tax=unclassified Acidithiobacillus TaxID=2614800 RepID=UPI00187AAED5|nr:MULTISPECIES: hypothetical protein [unclassified Acidithiobacillus]MBE7562678.1 hypothetical protein [Acidithiobacillus sp. HP-6]MBE7570526.1 hypothetical protein [Acidithiobacillus sp. HP-2]